MHSVETCDGAVQKVQYDSYSKAELLLVRITGSFQSVWIPNTIPLDGPYLLIHAERCTLT